ncbi:MAG: 50S ribosomal protein L15 [Chloroflexota bacterium]|nr:50S ribosomal protein L15 [Chloroflexota bacterium]
MKLHEVDAPRGARRPGRRVGRGTASGTGKTAGRGTKGQLARSGPGLPGWFEGGQTPLHMRVPKLRGFKPPRRTTHVAVNVGQLAAYAANGTVSPETLASKGLIRPDETVKILGDGDVTTAFEVHAHAVSATARQKIEAAGGSIELLKGPRGAQTEGRRPTRSSTTVERGAVPRARSD